MSESPSSPSAPSNPSLPPPPSNLPPPTGNLFVDALRSVTHIGDVPCARNSLLGGIAGGLGIGVIRGMSSSAFVSGNWACATFIFIALGSFQMCQNQLVKERQSVTRVIESMPRRVVKKPKDDPTTSTSPAS